MIRDAVPADAEALAGLVGELGYPTPPDEVAARLATFLALGESPLVFERDGAVIGFLAWHVSPSLHRATPVGRTLAFAVTQGARGGGVGRALLAAAEARMKARGCEIVEVTSNVKREAAHRFYEGAGYARSSWRFSKGL